MDYRNSPRLAKIVLATVIGCPAAAHSAPFGAPDSRSLAMGKTGVAAAENTHAGYFNPALLAAFAQRKHLGGNRRIAVPSLSAFASDSVREVADIDDAEYEKQLDNAVADFNNNTNIDRFVRTLESLNGDLEKASSGPLFTDAQVSLVFRIPDRREGGAFYYGQRALLDGKLDYTEADAQLLADYLEEVSYVNNGGTPATLHPDLYTNGQLDNPNNLLTSSVDAAALIIEELAFSMGWSVNWWGQDMLVGFTPKMMRVTTYEYAASATSGDLTKKGEYDNKTNLNLDLGWAKQFGKRMRLGLAVKNLLPQKYRTESGGHIELKPQVRVGGAYAAKWGSYEIDLDLLENDPLSKGDPTQELGIGAEWKLGRQRLRAGVVSNLAATGENKSPLYTLGVRFALGTFYSDLSYGRGKNRESAALQLGLRF